MAIDRSKVCPTCNLEMCLHDQARQFCSRCNKRVEPHVQGFSMSEPRLREFAVVAKIGRTYRKEVIH